MTRKGHLKLGAFLMATGHHIAGWRHPEATAGAGTDLAHWIGLAKSAEAANFDLLFLEDAAAVREADPELASQTSRSIGFEPLSLLAALAAHTRHIGLVATASTTYNDPFVLARTFATLDLLSGGRAGWNLVTSASEIEAANFGRHGLRTHGDRYARATEHADVVQRLWHPRDRFGAVHHSGGQFTVDRGLGIAASAQGSPVMVQAGSSDAGRALAARTADVVFTAAQTFEGAKEFYDDLKARVRLAGRDPDMLKIMPGVAPVIAETRSAAQEKFDSLQELIPDAVGLALLASYLDAGALDGLPLDGPLPELSQTKGMQSRQALVIAQARRDGLSIRALARHFAGARGHWRLVGTAADIVDELEHWFTGGAADGFNVMPAYFPGELDTFIALVIPELRRRGLYPTGYKGGTLRENLGIGVPTSRD
jgi:alkanesulfonate monooxygenase SsuD/methylene tetrahydromethanopterin reductase-like flavin-dependent oxidoreductase (luciferase family)